MPCWNMCQFSHCQSSRELYHFLSLLLMCLTCSPCAARCSVVLYCTVLYCTVLCLQSFMFPPLMLDAIAVIAVPECVEIAKNHVSSSSDCYLFTTSIDKMLSGLSTSTTTHLFSSPLRACWVAAHCALPPPPAPPR